MKEGRSSGSCAGERVAAARWRKNWQTNGQAGCWTGRSMDFQPEVSKY